MRLGLAEVTEMKCSGRNFWQSAVIDCGSSQFQLGVESSNGHAKNIRILSFRSL